jgi:hypothetical protein
MELTLTTSRHLRFSPHDFAKLVLRQPSHHAADLIVREAANPPGVRLYRGDFSAWVRRQFTDAEAQHLGPELPVLSSDYYPHLEFLQTQMANRLLAEPDGHVLLPLCRPNTSGGNE